MFLRRIVNHVRSLHWAAIFIDFVIVVVGVFLGLQAQDWNQARQDRAEEISYLAALNQDVTFSIGTLELLQKSLREQEGARAELYAYSIDPKATMSEARRDLLLSHGIFHLLTLNISQVTFETLKSTGRLSIFKSPMLVSELQSLSSEVANVLVEQADDIEVTHLFSDPMLIEDFDLRGVFQKPTLYGHVSVPWLPSQHLDAPTPEAMKSVRFRNILLYRSFFTESRLREVSTLLAQHRQIAKLIRARQAELGVRP